MHNLRTPLNNLVKKAVKWEWSVKCQKAFDKIKNILMSDLLTHFDLKLENVVASDASEYGIRAVILHKFEDGSTKPVAHASRTLPKIYSQIEKESLAIIFALKKFQKFVHQRKFVTDRSPFFIVPI